MTRPETSARARRLSAVLGAPPAPLDDADGGALGPGGVWPPPWPERAAARSRGDPPTVPLPVVGPPAPVPEEEPLAGAVHGARPGAAARTVRPAGAADRADAGGSGRRPLEAGPVREPGGRAGAVVRRLAPAGWRGARVDPGRPGATALALVAAAAAVLAAVGVWFERPRTEPVAGLPAVTVVAEPTTTPAADAAPAQGSAPTAAAPAPPLVLSVSGKVHRPGLVEVPDGSRVADVLEAAGGALPGTDLSGLNLARRVVDGEQVAVGVPPAPDAAPAAPGAGTAAGGSTQGAPTGKTDLNTATVEQLDALPGVGPVTAQRILEWRTRHGRFTRVEQLREIEGIGERRFAQLRELVTV